MHSEIESLAVRYGRPRQVEVTLPVANLDFSAITTRPSRVAEVVFAIQRPSGRLITQTKFTYPSGICRIPSGGIGQGESLEAALRREVREETSLEAEISRFLAIVVYTLTLRNGAAEKPHREASSSMRLESRRFTSYLFLLREVRGDLLATDEHEGVSGFREVWPRDLPALADALEALAGVSFAGVADWGDWGAFRAVAHRVAWEALGSPSLATGWTGPGAPVGDPS